MATPPDDLEQKVDLVLENIGLKERERAYHARNEQLQERVQQLEKKASKYKIKSQIKEWLQKYGVLIMGAPVVLMAGGLLYGCYRNISLDDRPEIRNMVPAFVEAANSKKEKELPDYISCKWGLQDNNSPIEEIIHKVLDEGYTIEQMNITGIESYKFFCILNPCDYSVAFETYLLQQGKDTKFKGLLPVSCDGDCKFNIVKNRIKSCPAYATIEKDEE